MRPSHRIAPDDAKPESPFIRTPAISGLRGGLSQFINYMPDADKVRKLDRGGVWIGWADQEHSTERPSRSNLSRLHAGLTALECELLRGPKESQYCR